MQKIIWSIILILIGLGFIPYKFPYNPDKLAENELHVDHEESTCSTDLFIVCGELNIPQDLKSFFPNKPTEFSIDNTGISMFDPINENQGNWFLISENEFIISGKVTGVDSSDYKYCRTYYPKFKIDKWSPTKYSPNFWSFGRNLFFAYFISLFLLVITSITFLLISRPWKSKT